MTGNAATGASAANDSSASMASSTSSVSNAIVDLQDIRKSYGEGTPVETEVLHGIDDESRCSQGGCPSEYD